MLFRVCLFCSLLFAPACIPPVEDASDGRNLLGEVLDATAVLGRIRTDLSDHPEQHCSGVVLPGFVLTAEHCTHVDRLFVSTRRDETWLPAAVVLSDPGQDLALLQVARAVYPHASLAREAPRYGDRIFVVGHPFGLRWTYSPGWVAHPKRTGGLSGEQIWLQHTAITDPGSSGGPVVNRRGELVGVTSFGIGTQNGATHLTSIVAFLSDVGLVTPSRR